jgi:uncharacterized repeat protein (TIGR01451 family)
MKRWLTPVPLVALALAAGCEETPQPLAPEDALFTWSSATETDEYAADPRPVHGAIFTTVPDGSAVNANTQYTQKIQVYLDGGPRNPNSQAAGLPNGLFVFQITDPPGKVLLSEDPAKCRVVRVEGGVITNIVRPAHLPASAGGALSNTFKYQGRGTAIDCHIFNGDNGQAGPGGRHDWNTDTDLGGGIVVQMMPFLDTPNPGGVYKAWMVPLKVYLDNGGSLETQRPANKVAGKTVGYQSDQGFKNPSRRNVKTDNFKVVENPPFVEVVKFNDLAPYGSIDGDVEVLGWPVVVLNPVEGGEVGGEYTTPTGPISIPFDTPVTVCEEVLDDWTYSYALVGGEYVAAEERTDIEEGKTHRCVTVTASKRSSIAIAFGNLPPLPELQIAKTPSSQTVVSGGAIVWQITVRNNGAGAATGVVLTDQLPAVQGGSYSVAPGSPTCTINSSNLLTCAVGTLGLGASFTATVTLQTAAGQFCGTVTNVARVGADRVSDVYSNTVTATITGCGRMTGGTGKVEITTDVYLTAGFTIHCDIILSNNLEINWPGKKWHIAKPITSAQCIDDPNVSPGKPDAPFDTFHGTAIGSLNGVPGSTVSFTFVDAGEPGKMADRVSLTIRDKDGNKVLDLTNQPIRGNLQAHEDQPHK